MKPKKISYLDFYSLGRNKSIKTIVIINTVKKFIELAKKGMINMNRFPGASAFLSYVTPKKLKNFEIVVFIICFFALGFILSNNTLGEPLSTDVTYYINLSLNNIKDPFVLNRYSHIFLQKMFLELSPTPLQGVQFFWAFLISCTAGIVYWISRTLLSRSTPIHGILAVLGFFSISSILRTKGTPLVDITAMFMLSISLVVYLIYSRRSTSSYGLLILMGVLFFLSLKTKETILIALIPIFLGLMLNQKASNQDSLLIKRMIFFSTGLIIGLLLFIILNLLILHDAWFGLRINDIKVFFASYVTNLSEDAKESRNLAKGDWYSIFLYGEIYLIFSLYLYSWVKVSVKESFQNKMLWLVPLSLILFIILTTSSTWGSRFFFPILPTICILGIQSLEVKGLFSDHKTTLRTLIWLSTGMLISLLLRLAFRYWLPDKGVDVLSFLNLIYYPLLYSLLLLNSFGLNINIFFRRIVNIALIFTIFLSQFITNFKIAAAPDPYEPNTKLIYPYSTFAKEILYFPTMKFCLSDSPWRHSSLNNYVKNEDEVMFLFNLYFDTTAKRQNFLYSYTLSDLKVNILSKNCDYSILSIPQWEELKSNQETQIDIYKKYDVFFDEKSLLVLLRATK